MSAWIGTAPVDAAQGALKELYEKALTPIGTVANVMRVHSQRPAPASPMIAKQNT